MDNLPLIIVVVLLVLLVVFVIGIYNGLVRGACGSTRPSRRSRSS